MGVQERALKLYPDRTPGDLPHKHTQPKRTDKELISLPVTIDPTILHPPMDVCTTGMASLKWSSNTLEKEIHITKQ